MFTVNDFIKLRQKDWQRLEALIQKSKGRSRLSSDEARELGVLYRAITSDLALARRDYSGQRVVAYLNQLLTRAHSYIYQQDVSDFRQLFRYFTHTIPQSFRQTGIFTFIAFLLFLIPGIVGYRLTFTNPDTAEALDIAYLREILADQETWTDIPVEERPYASTFIMSNNIRVAILAFGGGVALGLFSLYILAFNGLTIGGVLGLAAHYGMGMELTDFIFAHGVVELSIIFMSGGAGLQLGWALLNPGPYSRKDALGIAARRAVTLAVLAIPMLIMAGLIEGFISPSDLPFSVKAAVGIGTGVLLYSYLLLAGREKADLKNR
jgi:uncharacterized membrane protein SpoIIM required for sporulation